MTSCLSEAPLPGSPPPGCLFAAFCGWELLILRRLRPHTESTKGRWLCLPSLSGLNSNTNELTQKANQPFLNSCSLNRAFIRRRALAEGVVVQGTNPQVPPASYLKIFHQAEVPWAVEALRSSVLGTVVSKRASTFWGSFQKLETPDLAPKSMQNDAPTPLQRDGRATHSFGLRFEKVRKKKHFFLHAFRSRYALLLPGLVRYFVTALQ